MITPAKRIEIDNKSYFSLSLNGTKSMQYPLFKEGLPLFFSMDAKLPSLQIFLCHTDGHASSFQKRSIVHPILLFSLAKKG